MATTARDRLIKEIQLMMGGGMIDLELDPEHYNLAVTMAIDRYRLRSVNATEESFVFIDLQPNQDMYSLPNEIQLVRQAYRRSIGGAGVGATVDPFSLAFTNNLYMISNPGGSGTLATYELSMGFQEMAGTMFGREVIFNFNPTSHMIRFHRKFQAVETLLLWVYNQKPEEMLLNDVNAKSWLRDYACAAAKFMVGEARSKFSQIAGPQGGSTLNGEAMKTEAKETMDRLEEEVKNNLDGNMGYGFVIG